ncbi:hypothetical protein HDV01_000848 [Terramyces sp. JEL0728]|nr:hypothetical protein HDV01_000848 [Terramyces sp. JEL0728]
MITDYLIIIAIVLQIISSGLTIGYVFRRKTVKSLTYGFLTLLFLNISNGLVNLCFPIALLHGKDLQNITFPISNFLAAFIILVVVLLDIELLRVFAILNENITGLKLKILSIVSIMFYFAFPCLSQILNYILEMNWTSNYYHYSLQFFSLFGIIVDNTIAFYLPFLVYNYKQSKSKVIPAAMHQTLKKIGILNMSTMIIDWAAFIACFYINLIIREFQIPQDGYYIILSEILLGLHSIFQVIILNSLKELSLAEMDEMPSLAPPSTCKFKLPIKIRIIGDVITFLLNMITLIITEVATGCEILGLLFMMHYLYKGRNIRSLTFGISLILGINLILAGLNIATPFALQNGVDLAPINDFVVTLIILSGILVDIEILRIFSILDQNITALRLRILQIAYILLYLVMVIIGGLGYLFIPSKLGKLYVLGGEVFSVVAIVIDNTISIYLTYLVYNFRKKEVTYISDKVGAHNSRNNGD